jgi:hypothetical protein
MEHRRDDDGELLGELVEDGDGWIAFDPQGRRVTGRTDLAEARAALEELAGRPHEPADPDRGTP